MGHPRAPLVTAGLGTLLLCTALGNGLVLDDLVLKVRADPAARRVPGWRADLLRLQPD